MKKKLAIGHVTKTFEITKQVGEDEVPIGVVCGYLATWDVDRAKEKFMKGAFAESIEQLKASGRPLRLKRNHWDLIGGFPAESLKEDERGLYGEAEINLAVKLGAEAYALAKQGVLSDFSVGFSVEVDDIDSVEVEDLGKVLIFTRAKLWETSLVDEPMNPAAVVTEVRGSVSVARLPDRVAARELQFDEAEAVDRLRNGSGEPSAEYRFGFLWFDPERDHDFDAYRLPVVDLVDGERAIVPRAVFAARAALELGTAGVPEEDRAAVERAVNELYARMDLEPPFGGEQKGMSPTEFFSLPFNVRRDILGAGKKLSRNTLDLLAAVSGSKMERDTQIATNEVATGIRDTLLAHQEREEELAMKEIIAKLRGAINAGNTQGHSGRSLKAPEAVPG